MKLYCKKREIRSHYMTKNEMMMTLKLPLMMKHLMGRMQIIPFSSVFWVVFMSFFRPFHKSHFPRINMTRLLLLGSFWILGSRAGACSNTIQEKGIIIRRPHGRRPRKPLFIPNNFCVLTKKKNNIICINVLSQPDFNVRSLSENNVARLAKKIYFVYKYFHVKTWRLGSSKLIDKNLF